jgi:hypothetical protein
MNKRRNPCELLDSLLVSESTQEHSRSRTASQFLSACHPKFAIWASRSQAIRFCGPGRDDLPTEQARERSAGSRRLVRWAKRSKGGSDAEEIVSSKANFGVEARGVDRSGYSPESPRNLFPKANSGRIRTKGFTIRPFPGDCRARFEEFKGGIMSKAEHPGRGGSGSGRQENTCRTYPVP